MIYEIINPSDAYTMESSDPAAAALACLVLGEGKYGLHDEQGESACPIFLFGDGYKPWLKEKFGIDSIEAAINEREAAIADALDSVLIGGINERRIVADAVSKMTAKDAEQLLTARHEKLRTSMNDIGRRAKAMAVYFRTTKKVEATT